LTSRLYLLIFLIILLDRPIYLVFQESAGQLRQQYVGTASASSVRWALACRYGWFESGMAAAYAICGGTYCGPNAALTVNSGGRELSTSSVVLMPNWPVDSIGEIVLAQQGQFVAILEMDRAFRSLADRSAPFERVGSAAVKHRRSGNQTPAGR
jgi:hypothetical protein